MFKTGTAKLDPEDPWGGILSTVMLVLWSTIHTTHMATPMQLAFGRGNAKSYASSQLTLHARTLTKLN
eukprot:7364058-Ditylum_brightwellii.AAC.1